MDNDLHMYKSLQLILIENISYIKLIRTYTTLDISQKVVKCSQLTLEKSFDIQKFVIVVIIIQSILWKNRLL